MINQSLPLTEVLHPHSDLERQGLESTKILLCETLVHGGVGDVHDAQQPPPAFKGDADKRFRAVTVFDMTGKSHIAFHVRDEKRLSGGSHPPGNPLANGYLDSLDVVRVASCPCRKAEVLPLRTQRKDGHSFSIEKSQHLVAEGPKNSDLIQVGIEEFPQFQEEFFCYLSGHPCRRLPEGQAPSKRF